MVSLIAKSPLAGVAPHVIGTCALSEALPGPITSIAPFKGREAGLSAALQAAHGLEFPAPNRVTGTAPAQAVWSGQGQAFLIGAAPDARLSAHAALTDQSDGWAVLRLEGAEAEAVLARLFPLDLSLTNFAVGHSARSQLQHVIALLVRSGPQTFDIFVMRSFAQTALHEIETAMQGIAARAAL